MDNTPSTDARLALSNPAYEEWERLLKLLKNVRHGGTSLPHILALTLATNSHEIAGAMLKLWESGLDAGQLILLRALLESSTKFVYLAKCPSKNSLTLELDSVNELIKRIGPMQEPYREKLMSQQKCLEREGATKMPKFRNMLKEVNAVHLYPIYGFLSQHLHAQSSALQVRMLSKNERGHYVFAYKHLGETEAKFLWDTVPTLLASVSYDFDKFQFKSNA